MLQSCETTLVILLWCLLMSVVWTVAAYLRALRMPLDRNLETDPLGFGLVVPSLVLAPVVLCVAFRGFGWNLLFPIELFAGHGSVYRAALAPAAVLLLSSGLAGALTRQISSERLLWGQQAFATTAVAYGKTIDAATRRLVLCRGFLTAWSRCLPWIYGELIIVEAVFNAPGVGLNAWHLARERDHGGLVAMLAVLIGLYGATVALTAWGNSWLGKRLESYA